MRKLAAELEDDPVDLPMTPLIDMVFLLLSFFVFATQLRQQLADQRVQLSAHQGQELGQGEFPDGWQVDIDKTGKVTLLRPNAAAAPKGTGAGMEIIVIAASGDVPLETYLPKLKALVQANTGPVPPVDLRVDRATPFGRVSEVLSALNLAGFTKIHVPYRLTQPAATP
ncbi:MAG: ExbD/TolR family protein [Planctomycetota bacterium]